MNRLRSFYLKLFNSLRFIGPTWVKSDRSFSPSSCIDGHWNLLSIRPRPCMTMGSTIEKSHTRPPNPFGWMRSNWGHDSLSPHFSLLNRNWNLLAVRPRPYMVRGSHHLIIFSSSPKSILERFQLINGTINSPLTTLVLMNDRSCLQLDQVPTI